IFFDYNLPVITDPVVFTVLDPSGVVDEQAEQLVLFPSPTGGLLWLRNSSLGGNAVPVEVIDAMGRLVLREPAFLHQRPLDVSTLPSGAYVLRIPGAKGWSTARFTKL
ncbi:MAG: T9SS type A sorting domain-containing protein, partial [Flavobacteriales bacterium]|nr:T9SS type A sorting domain-containing protein [Flavobacteriales bacterium]